MCLTTPTTATKVVGEGWGDMERECGNVDGVGVTEGAESEIVGIEDGEEVEKKASEQEAPSIPAKNKRLPKRMAQMVGKNEAI